MTCSEDPFQLPNPMVLVPIVRSHLHGVDFYFDLMMSIEYIKMIQNITEV